MPYNNAGVGVFARVGVGDEGSGRQVLVCVCARGAGHAAAVAGVQFTRFTHTSVQILTQNALRCSVL